MSTSTHRLAIRTEDAVLFALPALFGVGMFVVMSFHLGIVGALGGGIVLFWCLIASGTGTWLFGRSGTRIVGFLLAAVALVATVVLCLVCLLYYVRAFDL